MSNLLLTITIVYSTFFLSQSPEATVRNFYTWYFNEGGRAELAIHYTQKSNGFTGLNTNEVEEILIKKEIFSEKLIDDFKFSYSECTKKLSKLPYNDYLKIDDIFDLEELACGVHSEYWCGNSLEVPETFEITKSQKISKTEYLVTVSFPDDLYSLDLELIYSQGKWLINKIR